MNTVECQRSRIDGSRKLPDGFGARARDADGELRVDEFIRRWKSTGKTFDLKRDRMPKPSSEPRCQGGRAGHAHLLAKNGTDS